MINPRGLLFVLVIFFGTTLGLLGQGINKNIWIFGDCMPSGRTILNFDPIDNEANVIALDPTAVGGQQPLGENTIATVIDQASGKLLFYSNGALFFNENHEVGTDPNLDGDETKPQSVAIAVGSFDQDPLVTDNYFIFYHTAAGNLGYQQVESNQSFGIRKVGAPNNTFKSNVASVIELVDQAKPNVSNSSFLFYYDIAGGNLHALHVNGVIPSTWPDVSVPLFPPGIVPVSIRFNEASNQVAVVSSTGEIAFVKFDRATGSFDPASIIRTFLPPSTAQPKAITFDPTGAKSYVTIGNQLYQIDLLSGPNPIPVLIPGITGVQELFDVQLAPNGKVYFLYRPIGSTEVKLGEIGTPSLAESDPGFTVNMDPFPSVNFCGKMFPNFSTTVYITPTVDIIVPPLPPGSLGFCADNPIQLVSKITPANLVPISYEWKIPPSAPPSPSSGPAPNLGVAHLILAGQGTFTVDLTVKFKDHPDITAPSQTVNFSTSPVPDVQLNPNPYEVVCPCKNPKNPKPMDNEGVDLSSWLQVDGSPAPSTGFEYFWSAFPEKGWTTNPEAKVCEPGFYYVMVRRVGELCYGLAEVLVEVVDNATGDGLEAGRNGKWFFGDKAGIDFNTFPLFPSPITKNAPRPLNVPPLGNLAPPITIQNKHPQRIEYGVDVFYDIAGNVIFYSDGEKVWDFGHAPIQIDPAGLLSTLGGDKSSSQSTLIIPYPNPEQPTARSLFYIFTSEVNAPYRVKFSMLDLAQGPAVTSTPPGNYLGTVASSNHLLLPEATQQMAGFQEIDKSFVAFKEMGSGRYRVHKIDKDGIHAPVFSESGNFTPSDNIISGALQFSSEGKYLASVYSYLGSSGDKSTVEIFSFDKITGDLSLYASFELSGKGHGIEISEDETRLFVSLDDSIREFFIETQTVSTGTIISPTSFNSCFAAATSVLGRSLCIKNSGTTIGGPGKFRSLQRGPASASLIFVAVENQNSVALIEERVGLTSRSVLRSPFLPMSLSGKVLKGLPRYNIPIPKSSSLQTPTLIGPNEMCLRVTPPARPPVTGIARYDLIITGEDLDVHTFRFERDFEGKVTVPTGITTFQSPVNPTDWTITFTQPGKYSIYVTVKRCAFTFPELVKIVDIYSPPFILPATINFCDDGSPLEIRALNETFYNMADFDIEWQRADPITLIPFGPVVSTSNKITFTNPITDIGQYVVTAKYNSRLDPCPSSTSVFIGPPRGLALGIVNSNICFDETLTAFPYLATVPATPPSVSSGDKGTFRIFKIGGTIPVYEISNSSILTLPVKNKLPAGSYELEFEALDTLARSSISPVPPKCILLLRKNFTILPEPRIDFVVTNSTNCSSATGEILLRNVDPSFNITLNGLPLASFFPTPNLASREEKITGLSAGSYLVVVENSGCNFSTNILVLDASQRVKIPVFSYEVEPVRCNSPLTKGQLTINFPTGFSGNYQIVNPFSTPSTVISGNALPISKKAVEYLDAGTYKLDFFDANNCFITSFTFEIISELGKTTSSTQYFCPLVTPNPKINLPSFLDLTDPNITGVTWKDSTGLILTPPPGSPFQAPSKGTYSLEVAYGACIMKFEIKLLERCSIEYTLPNTLQLANPAKGLANPKLQDNLLTLVTSNFVKNVKAVVYNRWGQLIHVKEYDSTTPEATLYEIVWDGKVNQQFVPSGTYVVVLFLTDLDGKVEKFTHSVLVLS